jgi:phage terminase small subunit
MPACRDPQHERFARALAEQYLAVPPPRRPVLEAFKAAGYAPHKGNASRLARRPEIRARVAELLEEAREYADIRLVKALVRVDRIADAKLPDYYERRDGALVLRDITALPPRLAEAIAELEYHDDGRIKRIKLHDKAQANLALLKHFGGAGEAAERRADVNIWNVLSVEDQRVLADLVEALARGSAPALAGAAGESAAAGAGA